MFDKRLYLLFLFIFFPKSCLSLNILIYLEEFPLPFQTFVIDDIIGLINHGHNVLIYSSKRGNSASYNLVPSRFLKYRLDKQVVFSNNSRLSARLRNISFDIIYLPLAEQTNKAIRFRNRYIKKAKIIVAYQGYDLIVMLNQSLKNFQFNFDNLDLMLTVSKNFCKRLIATGFNPEKVKLYYTGIDINLIDPKMSWEINENPKFISVGRLVEKKGFKYSIAAFAKVLEKHPTAQYIIIGNGPLKNDLEKDIEKYGIKDNVYLLGAKQHDEIFQYLKETDIFIVPSVTGSKGEVEGIPNVLKEAMFTKLPTIGTRHPGIPELIEDKVTGLLVDEKNIDQLAQAMEKLLHDQNLRERLGCAGYEHVYKYFRRETQDDFLDQTFRDLVNAK